MKILFTPLTGSSIAHIVRSFAIADELKKRGHETFFTSCNVKKKFIESNGYNVVKTYETINFNDPEDQSLNYVKDNKNKFVKWFKAEIDATEEIRPDIVVNAPGFLGSHTYHKTKIPVISIIDVQYLEEAKGLMGMSMSSDSLGDRIGRTVLKPIFNKKFISSYISEVNDIYRKLGMTIQFKSRKDLYEASPMIIPSDEILEPMGKKRSKTHYVGPIFWNKFENIDSKMTDKFISDFKQKDKLIFMSFGASVFDKNIYDNIIDSIEDIKCKKIICIGPNFRRNDFRADTNNLVIRNLVPGMRLTRHADIVINTGSQGAISQGIVCGKAQIVFPVGIDQSYYANRIKELGVGINLNKVPFWKMSNREDYVPDPESLHRKLKLAILRMIDNKKYRKKAQKYKDVDSAYKQAPSLAADIIESYAKP